MSGKIYRPPCWGVYCKFRGEKQLCPRSANFLFLVPLLRGAEYSSTFLIPTHEYLEERSLPAALINIWEGNEHFLFCFPKRKIGFACSERTSLRSIQPFWIFREPSNQRVNIGFGWRTNPNSVLSIPNKITATSMGFSYVWAMWFSWLSLLVRVWRWAAILFYCDLASLIYSFHIGQQKRFVNPLFWVLLLLPSWWLSLETEPWPPAWLRGGGDEFASDDIRIPLSPSCSIFQIIDFVVLRTDCLSKFSYIWVMIS